MPATFRIIFCIGLVLVSGIVQAAWPPSRCDHVRILEAGDADEIVEYDNARLQNADDRQRKVLGSALEKMPEILCQAVRRVAFIYRPPREGSSSVVDAWTNRNENQDLVYLNTWDDLPWNQNEIDRSDQTRAKGTQRFIHESTHAAIRMIQSQQRAEPYRFRQDRADEDMWPANAIQLAKNVINNNRLENGIIREWDRIHSAFVSLGMAQDYDDNWTSRASMTAEEITTAGFTSAYGSEQAIEDIAEMASWAIVRGAAPNPEDAACRVMSRRMLSSIDRNDAAIFTKLGFVQTLGFISEQQYKDCVGSLRIEVPGEGFYSYKDGNLDRSYTGNPRASAGRGSGDNEEWLYVTFLADGSVSTSAGSVAVTASLQINVTPPVDSITDWGKSEERLAIPVSDFSYPRGVYLIGVRHSQHNRMLYRRSEDEAIIVDVGQGIALIGRASSAGIEGSIAVQRIFNFSGGLLSAIAGDEPVRDPTKVTFKYIPD